LAGAVDVVLGEGESVFEERVKETVERLVGMPGQPQALGKWAFWTQAGIDGDGDGFREATRWAGDAMVLHAGSGEAREGMAAFLGKRKAQWST